MLYRNIGIKTRKETPKDEESKNAKLLIKAGYINKHMSGVYEFLPIGLRSLNKVIQIIREEMNAIGGVELFLTGLQNPAIWKKTDRWGGDADEVWFKSNLKVGGDVGFGWTHEEAITQLMTHHINSYRDLPVYLYQFQTKFRNEERAKSGILRTREFIMKDLYSFSKDEKEHEAFYEKISDAYEKIFDRVGLGDITYKTFASGGSFSKYSHEFQSVSDAGEDIIYIDKSKNLAINKEVLNDEVLKELSINRGDLEEVNAIEVGNIFTLGTRFSNPINLKYDTKDSNPKEVFMGSYGIGPARLLGTFVEIFGGEDSMVLPESISPFKVHLLNLDSDSLKIAKEVYDSLKKENIDVLFDDRDMSSKEKILDSELMGIPHRLIVSSKSREKGGVEYTNRIEDKTKIVKSNEINKEFL